MDITEELLKACLPDAAPGWAAALAATMPKYDINTVPRVGMFLAQCAHESEGFTRFTENLNYSAAALMRVWPSRFPSFDVAAQYERQPEKIANFVYANRLGNGNEASGDGWRYIGRGAIQTTGRANYKAAGDAIGYPLERYPTDILLPIYGAPAACWYWQSHGLNALADTGDFTKITQRINGGQVGAANRALWLVRINKKLGGN